MDQSWLKSALEHAGQQHDALRLRYVRVEEGWQQSFSSSEDPAPLDWVCFADLSEDEQKRSDRSGCHVRASAALICRMVRSGALPILTWVRPGPADC